MGRVSVKACVRAGAAASVLVVSGLLWAGPAVAGAAGAGGAGGGFARGGFVGGPGRAGPAAYAARPGRPGGTVNRPRGPDVTVYRPSDPALIPAQPGHPRPGHHGRRDRDDRRLYGYGYGYGAGLGVLPYGDCGWQCSNAPLTVVTTPVAVPVARLPTIADLPVGGTYREPPGAPTLYVINDESRGRSGRSGGAQIVEVGKPKPAGFGDAETGLLPNGPRIIELTAR